MTGKSTPSRDEEAKTPSVAGKGRRNSIIKKVAIKEEPADPASLKPKETKNRSKQPTKKVGASYSKDKQALMKEYYTNSEGLTDA